MEAIAAARPSGLAVWLLAARPRTLSAAVVPVVVGLAVAARRGALEIDVALATLGAALLIQIATNLANDYFDFRSGADAADRLGPTRITQAGLAEPDSVRNAAFMVLAGAALLGAFLVLHGGWPILAIGAASLISALAYTAGPFPLAHHGLGDLFVFLFFGVLAVVGTTYLQTGEIDPVALRASLPVGALSTAILVVNNLRDVASDRRAGKRTLAVRLGERGARLEYVVLVALAYLGVILTARAAGAAALVALLPLPLALREVRLVHARQGRELNASLASTSGLHLLTGLLLAAGLYA